MSIVNKGRIMDNTEQTKLISKIFLCKRQLQNLEPAIKISANSNQLYNKILIEKAVYQKKLEVTKQNRILSFFRHLFKCKKHLICDYFSKDIAY